LTFSLRHLIFITHFFLAFLYLPSSAVLYNRK
jgi:hypothetical protein